MLFHGLKSSCLRLGCSSSRFTKFLNAPLGIFLSLVLAVAWQTQNVDAGADKDDVHAGHRVDAPSKKMAVGWGKLNYPVPIAGSYRLPVIQSLEGGEVLNSKAQTENLADYYRRGKITVLSFIYTSCPDVNGCPLATHVMHALKKGLRDNPDLTERVQLISLSFDPDTDTPEIMEQYGHNYQGRQPEWFFLTTASQRQLKPILDDFGQFVITVPAAEDGKAATVFSHTLRVFLIDEEGRVRNIYSPDFLHRDILLADIRTLSMKP